MNCDVYQQTIDICQKYVSRVQDQNDKIIIYLGKCREWLNTIKTKTKDDNDLIVISDTAKFKSFIFLNGCKKLFIEINMGAINGIDLAEELGLKNYFGELFFVSESEPTPEQFTRIDKLCANYVSKSKVLEKIIYPKGN